MIREYEWEPQPGLPERLPSGETILWQGSPDWRSVAVSVMHLPWVIGWFGVVAAFALVAGGTGLFGMLVTLGVGALGCALILGLAYAQARTTIYTLTGRRVVLRFGVALTKAVNLPLAQVASADAKAAGFGCHDVALATAGRFPLAYVQMWPHVRPWRMGKPVPMLRGLDPRALALLSEALKAANTRMATPGPAPVAQAQPHVPVEVAA